MVAVESRGDAGCAGPLWAEIGASRQYLENARDARVPRSTRDAGGLTGVCPRRSVDRHGCAEMGEPCGWVSVKAFPERLHAPGSSVDATTATQFGRCLPSLMKRRRTTVAGVATSNRGISGERSESAACRVRPFRRDFDRAVS